MDKLKRGAVEIIPEDEFASKLKTQKPLRIKLGIDPTAPDIHLGHSVVLRKLRHFQEAGHQVVLIIGDYTAKIGDPTGRSETRKILTDDEIRRNTKTYLDQISKILNTQDKALFELRYNSEWLAPLTFEKMIELAHSYTVAQLLARKDFSKRFEAGQPIGLHEFFYPIMQGYDSVMIKADVELGGTDQKFNILVGRELQRLHGFTSPQIVFLMPIIEGTDGVQKMSKSLENYIGITDSQSEMHEKVMRIPDTLMQKYFELLTDFPQVEAEVMIQSDPRKAKALLAELIVRSYHDISNPTKEFIPEIPEFKVPPELIVEGHVMVGKLLVSAKLAPSMREAKRLLMQGAVVVDEITVPGESETIELRDRMKLQVGKLRFVRLRIP